MPADLGESCWVNANDEDDEDEEDEEDDVEEDDSGEDMGGDGNAEHNIKEEEEDEGGSSNEEDEGVDEAVVICDCEVTDDEDGVEMGEGDKRSPLSSTLSDGRGVGLWKVSMLAAGLTDPW